MSQKNSKNAIRKAARQRVMDILTEKHKPSNEEEQDKLRKEREDWLHKSYITPWLSNRLVKVLKDD